MPLSRVNSAPGWSGVAGTTGTSSAPAANSGGQGAIFGEGSGEYLDRIAALMSMGLTAEQAQAFASDPVAMGALSGAPEVPPGSLGPDVQQSVERDILAYQQQQEAPYRLTPQQQAIEDRFGNDMAWLDPAFQRQAATIGPITTQNAMQYGTTADPAAAAAQAGLLSDVRNRGITADANTLAAQQSFLQGLQNRGVAADPAAYAAQQGLLNQFAGHGISADPASVAQQRGLVSELANRGPSANAQSRGAQQGVLNQLLSTGPSANSGSRSAQQSLLNELGARGPSANNESRGAQLSLLNEIAGRGTTSDAQSEEAQRYAIDQLFGLYRQGGQDAQNRAARAQARADSESWLRGQREADIMDRAERGMSGSGSEILDLAADRQAAAQRLSAADLESDAAAERRALEALLAGTTVAGQARGQSDAYQASNTAARGALANAMRSADDSFANEGAALRSGLASNIRNADDAFLMQNLGLQGQVAGQMRNADDAFANAGAAMRGDILGQMRNSADAYDTTYAGLQSNLATNMRNAGDAYDQAIAQLTGNTMNQMRSAADAYQVNNDRTAAGLAQDMRLASDAYVGANADRLYNAAALNAGMINSAAAQNQQFLQNAWQNTLNNRQQWDQYVLGQQVNAAQGQRAFDAGQNTQGFNWGNQVASSDVDARNNAQTNLNSAGIGMWTGSTPSVIGANSALGAANVGAFNGAIQPAIEGGKIMGSMFGNYAMGAMGNMGGGGSQPIVTNSAQTNMARNPWLG